MKSFSLSSVVSLAVLANAVLAAENALIPSGISSACSSYLGQLDSDSTLTTCTEPLISATAPFAPGASSNKTSGSSDVSSALNSLCSSSAKGCDASTIRGHLTAFYAACADDLSNADVARAYDVLYTLVPLTQVVCAKDDAGKFCVTETTSSGNSTGKVNLATGGGAVSSVSKYISQTFKAALRRRASTASNGKSSAQQPLLIPNTTTFRSSNLAFLYLSPSTPKDQLCTTCTKNVLNTYTDFEASVPYALGIAQSPLLGNQAGIYSAVSDACGSSFLKDSVAQAAGGIKSGSFGSSSGASVNVVSVGVVGVVSVFGAFVALL